MNKIIAFVKEAYVELKKVNWPTREQTIKFTGMVIGVSLVVAAFLGLLDWGFGEAMREFVIE